jgi:Na+/H+ antiporter NhaB
MFPFRQLLGQSPDWFKVEIIMAHGVFPILIVVAPVANRDHCFVSSRPDQEAYIVPPA